MQKYDLLLAALAKKVEKSIVSKKAVEETIAAMEERKWK